MKAGLGLEIIMPIIHVVNFSITFSRLSFPLNQRAGQPSPPPQVACCFKRGLHLLQNFPGPSRIRKNAASGWWTWV